MSKSQELAIFCRLTLRQKSVTIRSRLKAAPAQKGGKMELTLVVKDPDSIPDGSATLYRTDRQSWVVQGWAVTDRAVLAALDLPEGETCVEIPDRLIPFFQTPR
jgi:hypothetical protein